MRSKISAKPSGPMTAAPDDPLIGVYVLSQFVFCSRAGLCAFENRKEGEEDEPAPANVAYLPRFNLRDIERKLEETMGTLLCFFGAMALTLLAVVVLIWYVHPGFAWLGLVALVAIGCFAIPTLCKWLELGRRQLAYQTAQPREPDPEKTDNQPIQWCELLQAGFMSIAYKDRLRDDAWKLEGRPWRVLRRGNLRIPVFRQPEKDARLHTKHVVKVGAYCRLLETCEGVESPYGIVLKDDSFEGTTVPNKPGTRKVFHDALRRARAVIQDAQKKRMDPPAPSPSTLCSGCPVGKPVYYFSGSENASGRVPLPVFQVFSDDDSWDQEEPYHSQCGDRFRWVPPHAKAIRKRLRPMEDEYGEGWEDEEDDD